MTIKMQQDDKEKILAEEPISADWNYHPALPLSDSSIFKWPPNFKFLLGWFKKNWLSLSERVMMAIVAIALWAFAYPSLEDTKEFAFGWVFQVWLVNMAMMVIVAGGLHWFFYMRKAQGKRLKFDKRDQAKNNRLWNFSDQVKDNMFWSLTSGIGFVTLFQIITLWLMANGFIPTITFKQHPVWFVLGLMLLPIWSAFHFYWVHRLLHVPFLYKHVHVLHHRNVNIGPWSGLSMHPVEHVLYLSSLMIHWVVPSSPIHLYFHVIYQAPGAAMTHTGYEDLLVKDKRKLALGTFYHQLHHRYYECNYGNQEMPWDRWFGTFHDGTKQSTEDTKTRRRKMYGG